MLQMNISNNQGISKLVRKFISHNLSYGNNKLTALLVYMSHILMKNSFSKCKLVVLPEPLVYHLHKSIISQTNQPQPQLCHI